MAKPFVYKGLTLITTVRSVQEMNKFEERVLEIQQELEQDQSLIFESINKTREEQLKFLRAIALKPEAVDEIDIRDLQEIVSVAELLLMGFDKKQAELMYKESLKAQVEEENPKA